MSNYMGKRWVLSGEGVVEDRMIHFILVDVELEYWVAILKIKSRCHRVGHIFGPIQFNQSPLAQTGVGISPTGPVEGTWVVGFYRDGEIAQEPVFFGTLGGIPTTVVDNPFQQIGFGDPRVSMARLKKLNKNIHSSLRKVEFLTILMTLI